MSGPAKILVNTALMTVATAVLFAAVAVCGLLLLVFSAGVADCAWNGSAVAWVDANANGSFDPGEQVLQNVTLHVVDAQDRYADIAFRAITDQHGTAQLDVPLSGCPAAVGFEVYADTPAGYKPTTEPRIQVGRDPFGTLRSGATYYFGFARVK